MSEDEKAANEPEQTALPDRTSPFPYAEDFDDWVAEEAAATDGRQGNSEAASDDPGLEQERAGRANQDGR